MADFPIAIQILAESLLEAPNELHQKVLGEPELLFEKSHALFQRESPSLHRLGLVARGSDLTLLYQIPKH